MLSAVGERRQSRSCTGRGSSDEGVPLASYRVVRLTITNIALTAVVANTATGPATCSK